MNEDTKLECLRLAVDFVCKTDNGADELKLAKSYYDWVTSKDKANTIKYEKTLKERE